MTRRTHVAIDIGASSGRHVLGWLEDGKLCLREMYRFENGADMRDGMLVWDHARLEREIVAGLKACRDAGETPETVAIDTWGVDYALLDESGALLGDTIAYRDKRTRATENTLDDAALYRVTGIQHQSFNTIYQLLSDQAVRPGALSRAQRLLFMPEYLSYCLTGRMENEYTIASTSGLLDARTRNWAWDIIDALGLPRRLFGALRQPGFSLGKVKPEIAAMIGFAPEVRFAPAHDTASAVLGAPLRAGDAFLSSGTWSLLGVEIDRPLLTEESRLSGLTNEGGVEGTYRLLKNIMGLWIVQCLRREIPGKPSFAQMADMARENAAFSGRIDVDAPEFLAPESMKSAILQHLRAHGQPLPQNDGELLACVHHSLAECYARTLRALERMLRTTFRRLCIVGGGSQNTFLNELTAKACGLPISAGPTEGTALGNLLSQMLASGEISDTGAARGLIRASFDLLEI